MLTRRILPTLLFSALLLIPSLLGSAALQAQLNSWHAAVQLDAVKIDSESLELRWDPTIEPEGVMRVWGRQPGSVNQMFLGETSSASGKFLVENFDAESAVEYTVQRTFINGEVEINGVGYITVGFDQPEVDQRGKMILLVDASVADDLSTEIDQLLSDLTGDGWVVERQDVARDAEVTEVKELLKSIYNEDPESYKSVYILGHVPVPYSGHLAPDGHIDHLGAWPADVYYADINGFWTDSGIDQDSSRRDQNDNLIGDGKFDQSIFASSLELAIGRVDFSNMPAFELSEVELLRQYLNRAHAWRHKEFTVAQRALIDDNFGFFRGEAFASSAYRSYATLVGRENIVDNIRDATVNYLTNLMEEDYLWSYGCGGGSYTSANGIGNTNDFTTGELKTVFTMLFGSYFGDWDVNNSFLRAPLAADGYCLMNVWSGRPYWYMHSLALGATTGDAAILTQNNGTLANLRYVALNNRRGVSMALMGDPAIRMHVVAPVTDLDISTADDYVNLSWTAPQSEDVAHYNVYRSNSAAGPFARINSEPLDEAAFSDPHAADGVNYYMVRAAVLQASPSGSYYNQSQGVFADIEFERVSTSVADAAKLNDFRVGPIPASSFLTFAFTMDEAQKVSARLLDVRGATVYSQSYGVLSGAFSRQIPLQDQPSGMYILEIKLGEKTYQTRIVRHE